MNCEVCGANYAEKHHVIFKSQAKYLENVPINFKYLCTEHHRGNYSPHMCRKIDKQYKQDYQEKILKLFNKDKFYSGKDIQDKLQITKTESKRITKKLMCWKEGYLGADVILRLLGGRIY